MKKKRKYNGDIFITRIKHKMSFSFFGDKLYNILYKFQSRYYQFLRNRDYESIKSKYNKKIKKYKYSYNKIQTRIYTYDKNNSYLLKLKKMFTTILGVVSNFFSTHKIDLKSKKVITTLSLLLVLTVIFSVTSNFRAKESEDKEIKVEVFVSTESSPSQLEYEELVDAISVYNDPNQMALASHVNTQEKVEDLYVGNFYEILINDHTLDGDGTIGIEYDEYEIKYGDNLSMLSLKIGATLDTIVSVNKITNANRLRPGAKLIIPNRNGLLYTVGKNETLEVISEKYNISVERIKSFNKIDSVTQGIDLFLPGARYTLDERIEKFGQIFNLPLDRITRVSSYFGYRIHPITGVRTLHRGIDFPGKLNTPIYASRGGTVTFAGYSGGGFGNLVIIRHKDGYTTYYGHLNSISTRSGNKVGVGSLIGRMGSTGRSTGSHLHLEIRRNGVAINPTEYIPVKRYLRR